ncbi:5457_t:CDS:2, partial [Ambispora gerdemannii]
MCEYQDKYNVSNTGRLTGLVTKAVQSIKRLERKQKRSLTSSGNQKRKKRNTSVSSNQKALSQNPSTTNIIVTSSEKLDNLDIEIARQEKLKRLELIDFEFQHKKELLAIEKRTKEAVLRSQELANIEKEQELGV